MKLTRQASLASLAIASFVLRAAPLAAQARAKVERISAAAAPAASFSVEVPLVQRFAPSGGGQGGTLVLNSAHSFNITLNATNQHNNNQQGAGVALPQTDTFGYFSFPAITGNPSNPEVFVKILDGRTHQRKLLGVLRAPDGSHLRHDGHGERHGPNQGLPQGRRRHGWRRGHDGLPLVGDDHPRTPRTRWRSQATPNAFVRTAIDISNNTNASASVDIQYSYICTAPTCSPVDAFYRTPVRTLALPGGGYGKLPPGRHRPVPRRPGTAAAGRRSGLDGNVPRDLQQHALQHRLGGNGPGTDLQQGLRARFAARNRRLWENASLFFESTNTTLVGNRPRHAHVADPRGIARRATSASATPTSSGRTPR